MIGIKKPKILCWFSKIQTYLSDKMHLKKVITIKHAKLGLTPKIAGLFVITLFRCILSLR
jgi:hypothetical protein